MMDWVETCGSQYGLINKKNARYAKIGLIQSAKELMNTACREVFEWQSRSIVNSIHRIDGLAQLSVNSRVTYKHFFYSQSINTSEKDILKYSFL